MFATRTNWDLKPNRLSQALARHRSSGRRLLDLTVSNPTECGFRYDARSIMRAFCHPASLEYHPDPRGLSTARQAVAEYYAAQGIQVSTGGLFLTVGTSEAYSYVFRLLCNPGDELLIPTPGYPLFDFLADVNDVRLTRYALFYDHGWHIDLHALEQAITRRTRGIIVVHPNNPTGHYTGNDERASLNALCAAHNLAIIADEVFLDFALTAAPSSRNTQHPPAPETPGPQTSFAANDAALTFTTSGISKICGLPQMKFAWLAVNGPPALQMEAMARLELLSDTYLSMNAPVQLAAPLLLRQRTAFQQQLMERVRGNLAALDAQLAAQGHLSRLQVEAGWYAVLRAPATRSDEDLALELLEKHDVYVHPGHFYDFPQDGYLVVSLITPEREFSEGMRKILSATDARE